MCYFAKRFQTFHRQLAHKGDAANSFFDHSDYAGPGTPWLEIFGEFVVCFLVILSPNLEPPTNPKDPKESLNSFSHW